MGSGSNSEGLGPGGSSPVGVRYTHPLDLRGLGIGLGNRTMADSRHFGTRFVAGPPGVRPVAGLAVRALFGVGDACGRAFGAEDLCQFLPGWAKPNKDCTAMVPGAPSARQPIHTVWGGTGVADPVDHLGGLRHRWVTSVPGNGPSEPFRLPRTQFRAPCGPKPLSRPHPGLRDLTCNPEGTFSGATPPPPSFGAFHPSEWPHCTP